ncbi:aspartate aminotransferase family protein [Actinomadura sp. WMMB 499]|uniref:aspartate aminotransferase family protein n=1 Tax=Actinomadura sp. WMMB 499 TaxID=1219491 RepID=UPI00124911F4|nr:aspartate aminotransferase family protein [Actinomadura sp. WMMB 499]QFG20285.1 aspartate aminotransferase family protein [Actinomadura sp. WMMB 499]
MSRTRELDRRHVFHSWSAQNRVDPMVLTRAEGAYVWDENGDRYLDFTSQLVYTNLGHGHPGVVAAIQEQAARLCTVAPQFANDRRAEAARMIAERAPEGMDRVFFTNGGADAVEHAVRMARLHTGRPKVLAAYRSYHGGTQTAINLTGDWRRVPNDTATAGVVHFFGPYLYRSEFHATTPQEESERALAHLRRTVEAEGPATIAAIVLETIPGTAGVLMPPPGYLAGVRELCDEHGILLVCDEVMAGFGRAGAWLAIDLFGLRPDLITFAKGVNSGYVPLGGVILGDAVADTFGDRPYPGGLTYSGHPLAAAAAVATLTAMEEEDVVDRAAALGATVIAPGLADLEKRHAVIGEVRGTGVFWAVELVADRGTREPLPVAAVAAVAAECRARGLLPLPNANRVHLVPPCTISDDQACEALDILDAALARAVR